MGFNTFFASFSVELSHLGEGKEGRSAFLLSLCVLYKLIWLLWDRRLTALKSLVMFFSLFDLNVGIFYNHCLVYFLAASRSSLVSLFSSLLRDLWIKDLHMNKS